jgi:PKD repeat protein
LTAATLISACTVSNSDVPGLSGPSEGSGGVLVPPRGGPPTASFTISPAKPVALQTVFTDASASRPASGNVITQYFWNWGDGGGGSGQQASHVYAAPGDYVITLNVVDNMSNTANTTKSLTIESGNPKASFIFALGPVATPRAVNFDANGSTAAGGATIVAYAWTFGDGASQPPTGSAVTSHLYTPGATYPVTLTVTDSSGRTGVFSQNINIP